MTVDKVTRQELILAARSASKHAYAPYSGFAVGAAVLCDSGAIYTGCNVENASYGLSICAERNAIFQAIANGQRTIRSLAVYTPTARPTAPCGACRQVLIEFGPDVEVVCACDGPDVLNMCGGDLLPESFGAHNLQSSG